MTRLRSVVALLITVVSLYAVPLGGALVATGLTVTNAACAKTPPDLTPEAQTAFKAHQVAQRIGELQDTAIAFNKAQPQLLNDRDAVTVVTFTVSALKTIQQAPAGWQATVRAAYEQLKQNLPPAARTQLQTVFLTVDTVLASLPR